MIKFKCLLPGLKDYMPIIPIGDYNFDWVKRLYNFEESFDVRELKTSKCPGIFSIMSKGWIQRAYQDIHIKTFEEDQLIEIRCNFDQRTSKYGKYIGKYVSSHNPNQLTIHKKFQPSTSKIIIKIQSPWIAEIPKGYSLLMMPVAYNDAVHFTAATGLIKNTNFLNVQLYWHSPDKENVIEKGTPLNQMILIKDISNDFELEEISNIDEFINETSNSHFEKFKPNK